MTPFEIPFNLIYQGTFFLLLFFFTIYGIILGYHWFSYGERRAVALGTLGVYITCGICAFILMLPAFFV